MSVFAVWTRRAAARRPAEQPLPASESAATPAVVQVPEITVAYPPAPLGVVASGPEVPIGPNGCTGKGGTCRGRGGPDRLCAAHKEKP